jgi:hypothetical protein
LIILFFIIKNKMISFDSSTHTYTVDGDSSYTSVTTLLKSWFKPFDADKCLRSLKAHPNKYDGMSDEAIKEKWTKEGEEASALGTALHADIEKFFQGVHVMNDSPEYSYFLRMISDLNPKVHKVEWRLCDHSIKLIGTIDFASVNKDGTLDLYDWKRSKDINKSYGFSILEELSHIPASKYWQYTLQLNMYKHLAEKNGHKVRRMYIVCFHPNNLSYQKYHVTDLDLKNVLNRK